MTDSTKLLPLAFARFMRERRGEVVGKRPWPPRPAGVEAAEETLCCAMMVESIMTGMVAVSRTHCARPFAFGASVQRLLAAWIDEGVEVAVGDEEVMEFFRGPSGTPLFIGRKDELYAPNHFSVCAPDSLNYTTNILLIDVLRLHQIMTEPKYLGAEMKILRAINEMCGQNPLEDATEGLLFSFDGHRQVRHEVDHIAGNHSVIHDLRNTLPVAHPLRHNPSWIDLTGPADEGRVRIGVHTIVEGTLDFKWSVEVP